MQQRPFGGRILLPQATGSDPQPCKRERPPEGGRPCLLQGICRAYSACSSSLALRFSGAAGAVAGASAGVAAFSSGTSR